MCPSMFKLRSLISKPYSTSSRLYPSNFSQFSFHQCSMKRRIDSDNAMDEEMKSLGSFSETKTRFDRRHHLNQTSNDWKKDLATFQPPDSYCEDSINDHEDNSLPISFGKKKLTYPSREVKQNLKCSADGLHQSKPFSLIIPRSRNSMFKWSGDKRIEMENNLGSSYEILRSGMILLKNYFSLRRQVEIVNICEEIGKGVGGFYQPGYQDGAKLQLHMMCFGRNWEPETKYDERYRSDGSEAPPVPDKLVSLVETALQYSHTLVNKQDKVHLMSPDICIVNFYTTTGRLGLHRDRDESPKSLEGGLPVVSISIGDSAEFLYGDKRDKTENVLLESGDVLIFGGKSRHIFHGVKTIIPKSAPLPLLEETMLRPGRLNLTFRQF